MLYQFKKLFYIMIVIITLPILLTGCDGSLPKPSVPEASVIYDVHGKQITTLYKENRVKISISKVPKHAQQAFIAVEDARFYKHFGLDPVRIIGAAVRDIKAGGLVEGGSTITQQVVKNLYLSREKTFTRKLVEAWYAVLLERKYTKQQILEMYLNQIYFGQRAYGIETASRTYFDKSASELTLAESAMLAGLPKAPNTYNPLQNFDAAKKRQKVVLQRMVDAGFLTQEEADKAATDKIVLRQGNIKSEKAPYVVNEVVKYVTDKYENGAQMLFTGGLSIYTGIDLSMQTAAEKAFSDGIKGRRKGLNGALVAVDPKTGQIRAMVGGRDFTVSKFNRATQAHRQPGSAFKPFLYTAAIDKGKTEASTITCEPVQFPQGTGTPYTPTDYGNIPYHNRPFTLKEALATSDNVVAVKLNNEIGPKTLVDYAHRMGITSRLKSYLSLALGSSEVTPLEITGAYATLASGGIKTSPFLITKIVDQNGNVLEENKSKQERILSPQTAYLVTDMMTSVLEPGGTGASLAGIINRPAAGKSGTTQNYKDAWFIGFTPQLTAGVYIGYDDPKKSVGTTGGVISGPIWAHFMADALKDEPAKNFTIPDTIVEATVCADTGLLATQYSEKTFIDHFIDGTQPKEPCPVHSVPGGTGQVPGSPEGGSNQGGGTGEGQSPGQTSPDQLQRDIMDWFSNLTR